MSVIVVRTIILYALIIFGMRIMGKRQLGELQPSELVTTIIISNIATLPIQDPKIPFLVGALPILTLVSFEVILSVITLKNSAARKIISGSPVVVIRNGVIDQKEMKNLRFSIDDLMEQLRTAGIFDISEVSYAIVETNGKLSVFQFFKNRNTTAEMLEIKGRPIDDHPPVAIITDGNINKSALEYCNATAAWLSKTLSENKILQKEVFLMTCDKEKNYQIIPKE